jgi:uncharacterized membrane protein
VSITVGMKQQHWDYYLAGIYLVTFLIAGLVLSLNRWWQLEHFYFNQGLFERALWLVAQGQSPLIDHFELQLEHQLGDHFTPTLYLFSVFFTLTDSYLVLPILKPVLITLAASIAWWLSTKLINFKLMRLVLLVCFTLFLGLQNALIGDFALEMVGIVLLAAAVYSIEQKNWPWFWSWFALILGLKESLAAVGIGLGCYLLWQKEYRKGLLAITVAVIYAVMIVKLVIPWFGGGYIYFDRTDPVTPVTAVTRFFWPVVKVKTMATSLAYFGWLPLLSPATLPLLAQDFYVRFVFGESPNWDLGLYYSTMTSIIMYLGSIKAVSWLERFRIYRRWQWLHLVILVATLAGLSFKNRPALLLVINRDFYRQTEHTAFLRRFVSQAKASIPIGSRVMTQNNLAPALTHEYEVVLLREKYQEFKPDVIMIDTRAGQNQNNFWPADFSSLKSALENDPSYRLHKITDEQLLYWKD